MRVTARQSLSERIYSGPERSGILIYTAVPDARSASAARGCRPDEALDPASVSGRAGRTALLLTWLLRRSRCQSRPAASLHFPPRRLRN